MCASFLALILVVSILTYYYFKRKLSYFERLGVPYVPGWPLLGNFHKVFARRQHLNLLIKELYDSHPEAMYVGAFDFGTRPVIVLRDPGLIKSITIRYSEIFPDHMKLIDENVDPIFGYNLFNMTGDTWKELRNVLTPAFTTSKLKAMFDLVSECADDFVQYIQALPSKEKSNVNTKDLFTKLMTNMIASCVFGIQIDSLRNPDHEFYVLSKKATNLEGLQGLKYLIFKSFPRIVRLFRCRLMGEDVANYFQDLVKRTVKTREEMGISRPDMLQMLMDARDKNFQGVKMDMMLIASQCVGALFAGCETTATFMCLMAHELAIHPYDQTRLRYEIDDLLTRITRNCPTYETVADMAYLDAVFNEVARKHPQNSFLDRKNVADFQLPAALPGGKPVTLKAGSSVWIPVAGLHRDPQYYSDPQNFLPSRYNRKKVKTNDPLNMSFGIGARSCVGTRFAQMMVKITFVKLMSKFKFKANEDTWTPMRYSRKSLSLTPPGGFSLDFQSRR